MDSRIRLLSAKESAITFQAGCALFSDGETESSLKKAAQLLRTHKLVAFPTETVYGLGANALRSQAVQQIYTTKGRPSDNPLIVHVSSLAMLHRFVDRTTIPTSYRSLMDKFWPGPLTLLFKLPDPSPFCSQVTAGLPTVAIRMPSSTIARALIELADVPIAAPSANTSGRPSPTTAQHVVADMTARYSSDESWQGLTVIEGPATDIGVESTIVDGTTVAGQLRVLRVGGIGPDAISACFKQAAVSDTVQVYGRDFQDDKQQVKPSVPGMKYRHYAPACPVFMLDNTQPDFDSLVERLDRSSRIGLLHLEPSRVANFDSKHTVIRFSLGTRNDASAHAARLFDGLRSLESQGAEVIFVECPGDETWKDGVGLAVAERLAKAAGAKIV